VTNRGVAFSSRSSKRPRSSPPRAAVGRLPQASTVEARAGELALGGRRRSQRVQENSSRAQGAVEATLEVLRSGSPRASPRPSVGFKPHSAPTEPPRRHIPTARPDHTATSAVAPFAHCIGRGARRYTTLMGRDPRSSHSESASVRKPPVNGVECRRRETAANRLEPASRAESRVRKR
jgi:hypothetical protein